jgi:hypothetical protein
MVMKSVIARVSSFFQATGLFGVAGLFLTTVLVVSLWGSGVGGMATVVYLLVVWLLVAITAAPVVLVNLMRASIARTRAADTSAESSNRKLESSSERLKGARKTRD